MKTEQTLVLEAGEGDQTEYLQAALDSGGRIVLEPGEYQCRGIRLQSDTELHLEAGADLRFVPDYEAYSQNGVSVIAEDSDRGMIIASGATNLSITGAGRIFGDGLAFTRGEDSDMGTRIPSLLRPRLLVLEDCAQVRLEGVEVTSSPMWTLHFVACDGVQISGLKIDNDLRMPNTDGIVIDSCKNVEIRDCNIRTADDGIVLKTSERGHDRQSFPCENVSVQNCQIESRSCAIKIGTESFADFKNISFENSVVKSSNRGLGVFSRDGGSIENIRFSNIALECVETPDGFWGSGEALTITVLDRRPEIRSAGAIRNVLVENISGQMQGAINLYAENAGAISGVLLKNISVEQMPGLLGTGERYDLRPTPADLEPSEDAGGRKNAWRKDDRGQVLGVVPYPGGMPGIFVHRVQELEMIDVAVSRPTPLPASWNSRETVISEA